MLDNLVLGLLCTTADDGGITSSEDRNGILANIAEPHVGQRAGAEAVDTLEGLGTDDNVGKASTVVQDEDGAIAASVVIRVASPATVELLVAQVDLSGDGRWRRKRDDAANTAGDVERLRRGKSSSESRKLDLSELHIVGAEV